MNFSLTLFKVNIGLVQQGLFSEGDVYGKPKAQTELRPRIQKMKLIIEF